MKLFADDIYIRVRIKVRSLSQFCDSLLKISQLLGCCRSIAQASQEHSKVERNSGVPSIKINSLFIGSRGILGIIKVSESNGHQHECLSSGGSEVDRGGQKMKCRGILLHCEMNKTWNTNI